MDFASASDVQDRWRLLSDAELARADILIGDASDMIRTRWPDAEARITNGSLPLASVTRVVASMVKRAMLIGDNEGVESRSQTAGPFAQNDKFANPTGSLYFTNEEVRVFEPETFQHRAVVGWLA